MTVGRPAAGSIPTEGSDLPHVVVVGAGFGGLWAARTLEGKPVRVTLVDRNNYHTFFPLLYQVAAAELSPTDIAHPVRSVFRGSSNVEIRMAEMTGLDLEGREVRTDAGALPYDHLILALGSEPHFFGVPGAEEHAFALRWMDDAIPLRRHVLTRFERAAATADVAIRQRLLTFVVVGGGPTGVEFAGALSELIHGPLGRDFPEAIRTEARVVLVEAMDGLLKGMPAELGEYARSRLRSRNVEVRLGRQVVSVSPRSVEMRVESRELGEGGGEESVETLATETVVWTAGVRGDPRAEAWGLPVGRGGRVQVKDDLTVPGHPELSVVGDLAGLEDEDGVLYPQVAQVAIQQGIRAAENVLAREVGRVGARGTGGSAAVEPFRYKDLGMLAVIGRNAAVAHVFGRTFKGFLAWVLWLSIHIVWLMGFRNRALVLVNWAWNYFFPRRGVRLVLPGEDEGRAEERAEERAE